MTPQAAAQIQEMTVTPVEAERIVSRDANVALLVIESAIPGLTIRSNIGELAQEQQGSRTVISLGAGRQRITFSAPSYQNASILIDAKAREQYAYEVVGAASERIMELRADFEILPRLAQLTVNGELVGSSRSLVLPLGPNRVQIEADGYESIDTEITVSPQERNVYRFELDLIALYALIIETTPPGAVLQLDGVTLETVSPYTGFFPAGTYEVSATLPGYATRSQEVTIGENRPNRVDLELTSTTGQLVLAVDPQGAQVTINRRTVDASLPIALLQGSYDVLVEAEGFVPSRFSVSVGAGARVERAISLEPITGTLRVAVTPPNATVRLIRDGLEIDRWEGPRSVPALRIGTYVLEASLGGARAEKTIVLGEGEVITERLTLDQAEMLTLDQAEISRPMSGSRWVQR
ncbi:MAG: PEGA domain-containing protein, partial [Bacteroidetes bacterium]|nr:PEGA domain-containing protein [Bacteroidota bacterium]